ncbi:hypothetical protein VI817_002903 [Penicillium citrinum]|nr:hypothetical protein VI817_002903 [Penicillium citrinum]
MSIRISQTGLEEEVQWDCQLRQTLCCMMRFFVLSPQAFESVFSEIYCNELKSRGLEMEDAVSYDYLHREWSAMKRRNSGVWHHVHTDTSFTRDGEWQSKILQIQSTAAMLGITIMQQDRDPVERLTCDGMKFDGEYLESILLVVS